MYIGGDENSQRWIKDFKQQLVAVPEKLENIDGAYVVHVIVTYTDACVKVCVRLCVCTRVCVCVHMHAFFYASVCMHVKHA